MPLRAVPAPFAGGRVRAVLALRQFGGLLLAGGVLLLVAILRHFPAFEFREPSWVRDMTRFWFVGLSAVAAMFLTGGLAWVAARWVAKGRVGGLWLGRIAVILFFAPTLWTWFRLSRLAEATAGVAASCLQGILFFYLVLAAWAFIASIWPGATASPGSDDMRRVEAQEMRLWGVLLCAGVCLCIDWSLPLLLPKCRWVLSFLPGFPGEWRLAVPATHIWINVQILGNVVVMAWSALTIACLALNDPVCRQYADRRAALVWIFPLLLLTIWSVYDDPPLWGHFIFLRHTGMFWFTSYASWVVDFLSTTIALYLAAVLLWRYRAASRVPLPSTASGICPCTASSPSSS